MRSRLLLVLLLAAGLFAWRLDRPGFSDTEGMYAEPAREMVLSGDWVTPRLNGEPFLTKPPLMYWLAAAVFSVAGPTEYARVWPALAALGTVAVTGLLGAELFGEGAGLIAAVVLATTAGLFMEARLLRADAGLVLTVTVALWCYVRSRRRGGVAPALGLWAAIGVGLLDKGLLALLLPGMVIGLTEILTGELRPATLGARLGALRAPLGIALIAAIVLPWHLVAAWRNPGFAWDYVVNQHLLFFFDRKLPRDSIPDSLGFFWAIFAVRGLPWSLFWPAAVLHGSRTGEAARARTLLLTWIAVVLGFFSLAASRLEHYSLPALPAMAILVGRLLADVQAARARVGRAWMVGPPALVALLALVAAMPDPRQLIVRIDPMLASYSLASLARPTAAVVVIGLGAVAVLLATRRAAVAVLTGSATAVALFACVEIAHERVEPLFSWRHFATAIRETAPAGTPVFFRASDEYQLCGGLDYYTSGFVSLLAPPGWVPPTFLERRTDRLFVENRELAREWKRGRALLVSDDVAPGDEDHLVPGPWAVVARAGSRVALRPAVPVAAIR